MRMKPLVRTLNRTHTNALKLYRMVRYGYASTLRFTFPEGLR